MPITPFLEGRHFALPARNDVPTQALLRLVQLGQAEGGVFDPEAIAVMATAFEKLLLDLKLADRDDPAVTMVAKLVIELVRNGERDPQVVREEVLGLHLD
jgi:hypothetical protein